MMPLIEIDRLKRTVTGAWESPVADQVAAARGYPAGTAKWWRFQCLTCVHPSRPGRQAVPAVRADAYRSADSVAAVVSLMDGLGAGGAAVVFPAPALTGH